MRSMRPMFLAAILVAFLVAPATASAATGKTARIKSECHPNQKIKNGRCSHNGRRGEIVCRKGFYPAVKSCLRHVTRLKVDLLKIKFDARRALVRYLRESCQTYYDSMPPPDGNLDPYAVPPNDKASIEARGEVYTLAAGYLRQYVQEDVDGTVDENHVCHTPPVPRKLVSFNAFAYMQTFSHGYCNAENRYRGVVAEVFHDTAVKVIDDTVRGKWLRRIQVLFKKSRGKARKQLGRLRDLVRSPDGLLKNCGADKLYPNS